MTTEISTIPQLSDEQDRGIEFLVDNYKQGLIALAGPAGSGKTTLIKKLVPLIPETVTVAAMTNKAAYVLRTKGIEDAVTLHQAAMRPKFRPPMDRLGAFLEQAPFYETKNEDAIEWPSSLLRQFGKDRLERALADAKSRGIYGGFRSLGINDIFKYIDGWTPKDASDGVLIIDEASMLGGRDLDTVQEVYSKIILIGDEHQLPPVKSAPIFWNVEKRFALTEIHRQAEGSQPLQLATALRTGGTVQPEALYPIDVAKSKAGAPVICWRNQTRIDLTKELRNVIGYGSSPPQVGEVLICRNVQDRTAKSKGLINNSLWKVVASDGYELTLENDDGDRLDNIHSFIEEYDVGWGIPFRFAYALTAHTAQGSQWNEVMIHFPDAEQYCRFAPEDFRQWLYTAITRAATWVYFVTDKVVLSA